MDWSIPLERSSQLISGFSYTLMLCNISVIFSVLIGSLLAWGQMKGGFWLRKLTGIYISFCLGLPLLVIIYLFYYFLPSYGITLDAVYVGIVSLSIYYGPYFSRVMQSAVSSLPRGQIEAAEALGISQWRCFKKVLLPQVLPMMLPPSTGLVIGLIKDSALLSIISVPEFMFYAREAVSETYAAVEIYLTIALVYWIFCSFCAAISGWVEKRLSLHMNSQG